MNFASTMLLRLVALVAFVASIGFFKGSQSTQSAIHEIEGLIAFLIFVCSMGLSTAISVIDRHRIASTHELKAIHRLALESAKREMTRDSQSVEIHP